MTTTSIAPPTAPPAQGPRWNRPLLGLTAAMTVLTIVTLVGILVDDRMITGAPVWLKPFKFSTSFLLYAVTLAWMLTLLPQRNRRAERAAVVIVAMSVIEMLVIVLQAGRGQASHFNTTSSVNAALFSVMGLAVMVLFAAQFVVALVVLRSRIADRVAAAGVRLGLALSLLGMLAAVPMVLPAAAPGIEGISGAHSVGVLDGGPGLPILGWSTTGGDLRAGHFVGLHALQALPLLALLLIRFGTSLSERVKVRLLLVAGAAYGAVTVLLSWQALRGQSIVAPDALSLAALGVVVVGTLGASGAVLARGRRNQEGELA